MSDVNVTSGSQDDSVPEQPPVQETALPEAPPTSEPAPAVLPSEEDAEATPDEVVDGEAPAKEYKEVTSELVSEVLEGKWAHGQERRRRLAEAGYDHVAVEEAITERMNQRYQ